MRILIQTILWVIDAIVFFITFTVVKTNFMTKYTNWVITKQLEEMDEDARRR